MVHVNGWVIAAAIVAVLCASIVGIAGKDWRPHAVSLGVSILALFYFFLSVR